MENKGFLDKCINFLKDIIVNIIVEFVLKYPVVGILIALLFGLLIWLKETTKGCAVLGAYVTISIFYYISLRYRTKQEYNKFTNNRTSYTNLPYQDRKNIEKATSKMQMTNIHKGIFFLNCLIFSVKNNTINGFSTSFNHQNTNEIIISLYFHNTKKTNEPIEIKTYMDGQLRMWVENGNDHFNFILKSQQIREIHLRYDNLLFNQLCEGKHLLTIFANNKKIVNTYIYVSENKMSTQMQHNL